MNSFIISWVDYCNSLLSGAPACLTFRVQSVLNAATCFIYDRGQYDHVTDLIWDRLYRLPACQWIRFKCGLLGYKGLHGFAPSYIADYCVRKDMTQNRYSLQISASTHDNLIVPHTKTQFGERSFGLLVKRSGTHYQTLSRKQSLSKHSKAGSRRIFLNWIMTFNVLWKCPCLQQTLCWRHYINWLINNNNNNYHQIESEAHKKSWSHEQLKPK